MLTKPKQCKGCAGQGWLGGKGWAEPEGSAAQLGVVIMGEAPGEQEAHAGLPFRPSAQAGSQLQRAITLAGLQRGPFLITNTIQCRPPENWLDGAPWEQACIAHCQVHRDRILVKAWKGWKGSRVILALGDVAFRTLTGIETGIMKNRGYPVWNERYQSWVIGSLHPAHIARGKKNLLGVLRFDLLRAVEIARQKRWKPQPLDGFVPYPSLQQAQEFYQQVRSKPGSLLCFDLENPKVADEEELEWEQQPITQIQFSLGVGTGICFPWTKPFINIAKKTMKLVNPKIGHNSALYDIPILRAEGFEINGEQHDTLKMMRHLQSNIAGCYHLQGTASFFGADRLWKHLVGSQPQVYGCFDVSEPLRIFQGARAEMMELGIWDSYMNHVVRFDPIIARMCRRGLKMNQKGQARLSSELDQEKQSILAEMEKAYPLVIRTISPKNGYVREPKDKKRLELRKFNIPDFSTIEVPYTDKKGKQRTRKVKQETGALATIERWCRMEPFKLSHHSIARYVKLKGWKAPKHRRENRDSFDEKGIERLLKAHPDDSFLALIPRYQSVKQIKSMYVDSWRAGPDGRIHSHHRQTASGQIAMFKPNIQQIPRA